MFTSFVPVSRLSFQSLIHTLISLFLFFLGPLNYYQRLLHLLLWTYVSWKPLLEQWLVPVDECWLIAAFSLIHHVFRGRPSGNINQATPPFKEVFSDVTTALGRQTR